MYFFSEFRNLIRGLLSGIVVLLALASFFFAFGPQEVSFFGSTFTAPLLSAERSFAVLVFERMWNDLVPSGMTMVVMNPLDAFMAQVKISLFFGFFAALPILLYGVLSYLFPALYIHERRATLRVLFPAALLFAGGCLFAYTIVIPATFTLLYPYAESIGALPFFAVGDFIALSLGIMFVVGCMFLLPVCMFLLNRLGMASAEFWRHNWGYALVTFLVLSAIITPDGSGISMILLALPLAVLYGVGVVVSRK